MGVQTGASNRLLLRQIQIVIKNVIQKQARVRRRTNSDNKGNQKHKPRNNMRSRKEATNTETKVSVMLMR